MEPPYIFGSVLFFAGVLFLFVALLFFIYSFLKKNKNYFFLGLTFLMLSIHGFSTGVPALIYPDNPMIIGVGYLIGKTAAFLSLLASTQLLHANSFQSRPRVLAAITSLILFSLCFSLIMYFITNPVPTVSDTIILYNDHWLVALISGITFLMYGVMWGVVFYQEAMKLPYGSRARTQTLILAVAGAGMAFAGFLGFIAQSGELMTLTVLFIIGIAVLSFISFFLTL